MDGLPAANGMDYISPQAMKSSIGKGKKHECKAVLHMKDGMDRYASKERFKQKGYLRKHCDRSSGRKAHQASRRDSLLESRKRQEEDSLLRDMILSSASKVDGVDGTEPTELETAIQSYGKVVLLTEEVVYIGDENGKSKTGIGEPVQSSGEISSEVGGVKSSRRRSSSRNEKVRQREDGKDGSSRKKKKS